MAEKEFILTQEGYDNLEKELEKLKTETRYEIAERIKVALGFGDLSENSEYDEEFDEEVEYTIVGSTEVDLSQNKISNESPIGQALLGKKKNQIAEVQAPAGIIRLKIKSITK